MFTNNIFASSNMMCFVRCARIPSEFSADIRSVGNDGLIAGRGFSTVRLHIKTDNTIPDSRYVPLFKRWFRNPLFSEELEVFRLMDNLIILRREFCLRARVVPRDNIIHGAGSAPPKRAFPKIFSLSVTIDRKVIVSRLVVCEMHDIISIYAVKSSRMCKRCDVFNFSQRLRSVPIPSPNFKHRVRFYEMRPGD